MSGRLVSPMLEITDVHQVVTGYRDRPEQTMKELKDRWAKYRGFLIPANSDLYFRLNLLTVSFHDMLGYPKPPSIRHLISKPEGKLWKACIAQEIPLLVLDMIREDRFAEQPSSWISAVLILNAGLSRILGYYIPDKGQADSAEWPDLPAPLKKKYVAALRPAVDALWRDRSILMSEDDKSKLGRDMARNIILFIYAVLYFTAHANREYRKEFSEIRSIPGVAFAAFLCFATAPNPVAQMNWDDICLPFQVIRGYRNSLYSQIDSGGISIDTAAETWRTTIESALDDLGSLKFMRTCHTALLTWPDMVGMNLRALLDGIKQTVTFRGETSAIGSDEWSVSTPSRRAYLDTPMLHAVAVGLEREISAAPSHGTATKKTNMKEYPDICIASCDLLDFHEDAFIKRPNNPPMIDGRSIYTILSKCLFLLITFMQNKHQVQTRGKSETALTEARNSFGNACIKWAIGPVGDRRSETELQTIAVKRVVAGITEAANKTWFADIHALRSLREKFSGDRVYETIVEIWLNFGKAFELEETTERDKHDAASKHMCSWAGCSYHTQPSAVQLSACSGCGERRYCSRECQKKDWKQGGHRESCRRLNT